MKTVLIVGAAGKIGFRLTSKLAESGDRVLAIDLNESGLLRFSQQSKVQTFLIDIVDEFQVVELAKSLKSMNVLLDGIVFCSGIDHKVTEHGANGVFLGPENFPLTQWNADLSSALTGTFLVLKHLSSIIKKGGSVVLLGSDLSVISPTHQLYNLDSDSLRHFKPISYSVVKAALLGFSRYFAVYFGPRSIRVNVVSPGAILDGQPSSFVQAISGLIPMGKMGSFDDTTDLIEFLLSEKSSYVTGQNILVDGGRTTW